jgi:hypothetical protein
MSESKAHTASGTHAVDAARDVIFFVEFGGGASGTATLQRKLGDGWVTVDTPYTATMDYAEITDVPQWFDPRPWRWNVTVSAGTITTFLQVGKYDRDKK